VNKALTPPLAKLNWLAPIICISGILLFGIYGSRSISDFVTGTFSLLGFTIPIPVFASFVLQLTLFRNWWGLVFLVLFAAEMELILLFVGGRYLC
jgi:hypothetical protein